MTSYKLEWLKARMENNSMKHNFKEVLTIFIECFNMLFMFSSTQFYCIQLKLFIQTYNAISLVCIAHYIHYM
jgi:hypothetical protein